MTLRSWLELLVVPLALVVIGFLFSVQQDARQQRIEDQRAAAERELSEQRAQDEALQAYLSQMSGLLLERDLRASEEDSEVRTLARARTLTVLGRLDPSRKRAVMEFLAEAKLIQRVEGRAPVIELSGAELHHTSLRFQGNLHGADLRGANLSYTDLSFVDLSGANLSWAGLFHAELFHADLSLVDLSYADLGADLRYADLHDANLSHADLYDADLSRTNLSGADLYSADLGSANLRGAKGWTEDQLSSASLEGATMPNGQKYEEWLKDKKAKGKDAKNE